MKAASIFFRSGFRSRRLDYILEEVLGSRLGLDFRQAGPDDPLPEGAICLNYGLKKEGICLPESGILRDQAPDGWSFSPGFDDFRLIQGKESHSGDLFGAAFFLLSRFEEQTKEAAPDMHSRFPDTLHFSEEKFRAVPLVEFWVNQLRQSLEAAGISCRKAESGLRFSIDLDNPTAYLHKGFFRQAGGLSKDLLKGNFEGMLNRLKVLSGSQPDPYDNLGSNISLELLENAPIFFWLGNYGKHDKGLTYKNAWYRNKIRELSTRMQPGLHPSYQSFDKPEILREEKKRLEAILGREIRASRFHFLRFRLPDSYRLLEELGIKEDHSMGFSGFPGFRAGTALPFRWFDLKKNQAGDLLIHPFSMMDSWAGSGKMNNTLFMDEAERQLREGRKSGFPVHAIFHNEHPSWPGWENALSRFLALAKNSA